MENNVCFSKLSLHESTLLLVHKNDKSIDHLFVSCVFSQQVWSEVLHLLEITNKLEHNSIEGNLRKWFFSVGSHKSLPLFVIWGL